MSIISPKPFSQMSLPELRAEFLRWQELLGHTVVLSARESVQDVMAIIATWIVRREREEGEAKEGVAA